MRISYDNSTVRRVAAGIGLIGFSVLLVPQDLVDPSGDSFYDNAVAHRGMVTLSALLLLVSAVLTVPAIGGLIHQARDRGAVLTQLGAFFALLGAMGHMGLATLGLISRSLAGGDPDQMHGYEDRLNNDPILAVFLILLLSFGVGLVLLAFGAWRAGLIGWWGPALIGAVVVAHFALPDDQPAVVTVSALTAIAVVFGRLGVRTLRLSTPEWDGQTGRVASGRVNLERAQA